MERNDTGRRILEYLTDYIDTHGYGPTVREIAEAAGLRSTATVHYHLRRLAQAGRIVLETGRKRAVSLPDRTALTRIPLVGLVTAGQPILAVEQIEGYVPWPGGEGWFALRVRGESMKNAGILDGDLVIVRPQPDADSGDIVVALLEDEATVKRLRREDGKVWLMPENEAFAPIDGTDARILGLVKGVVRTY